MVGCGGEPPIAGTFSRTGVQDGRVIPVGIDPGRVWIRLAKPCQHNILYLPSAARQTQRNGGEREERGMYRRSPSVRTIESLMSQGFGSGCAKSATGATGATGATSTEGIGGLGRAAEDTVRTNENRMSQIFGCGCVKRDNRNLRNGEKFQSICFWIRQDAGFNTSWLPSSLALPFLPETEAAPQCGGKSTKRYQVHKHSILNPFQR